MTSKEKLLDGLDKAIKIYASKLDAIIVNRKNDKWYKDRFDLYSKNLKKLLLQRKKLK